MKFVSITYSERNIWNGPIVATAISREKRKPMLEGNVFAESFDNLYAPCIDANYTFLRYSFFFKLLDLISATAKGEIMKL